MRFHRQTKSGGTPQFLLVLAACSLLGLALDTPQTRSGQSSNEPARYAVIDLGTNFTPAAINNNGDVVGTGSSLTNIVFWHAGTPTSLSLPTPPYEPGETLETVYQHISGLNDSGTVMALLYYTYLIAPHEPDFENQVAIWTDTQSDPTLPPTFSSSVWATSDSIYGILGPSNAGAFTVGNAYPGGALYWNNVSATAIVVGFDPLIDQEYADISGFGGPANNTNGYFSDNNSHFSCMNRLGDMVGVSSQDATVSYDEYGAATFSNLVVNPVLWNYGSSNGSNTVPTILPFSWSVTSFTDSASEPIYVGISSDYPSPSIGHIYDPAQSPSDIALGAYLPLSINTPTDPTQVQMIANDAATETIPYLYEKTIVPPATLPTWITTPWAINSLINPSLGWKIGYVNSMNNYGEIVGTATYTQIPYAPIQHGVLLLPCQLRLLNEAQSGPDGMDFNGTRPTTISATAAYNTQATYDIGTTTHGNAGIDVIGNDLPLGVGRPGLSGQAYTYSILMLAKVSSSTATNITYAWGRVYQDQSVTIAHTATNTWYVNVVGTPTGVPTPELDTGSSNFTTTTPSTNNNVVTFYDNPAMAISDFTSGAPNTNDFAYEKTDFTYFLTNSIGSVSAVAQQHVGQILLAKRTGTSGVIANDWTGITNYMSTANVPNCTTVSTNEIRNIVGGTNAIIFDPSVPASP